MWISQKRILTWALKCWENKFFLQFLESFAITFFRRWRKTKGITILLFSCGNAIFGKILFQDLYAKCRVVQPDWRILWSSISMEGINSYHRLFELASETAAIILVWIGLVVSSQIAGFFYHQNICNQLISSIWKYWFWFGIVSVASQIQTYKSSGRSSCS